MSDMVAEGSTKEQDKKPKTVKVRVIYNGDEQRIEVAETDLVSVLLTAAIAAFPVTEAQHLLALFDMNGIEITNEAQTVEEAGLKNNVRLILRQSAVKGG
jgi:hypothetical protein